MELSIKGFNVWLQPTVAEQCTVQRQTPRDVFHRHSDRINMNLVPSLPARLPSLLSSKNSTP